MRFVISLQQTCCNVIITSQGHIEESLIIAKIKIYFPSVVKDIHLSVLVWRECASI